MADIFDRVGSQLASPAQPATQPTNDVFAQVGQQLAQPSAPAGDSFAAVGQALAQNQPVTTPQAPPTFGDKLGAGIGLLFNSPAKFAQTVAPAMLGDQGGAAFNAGAYELTHNPIAGISEIPGALKEEGLDAAKEAAMAVPRALAQTSAAGASTVYRGIGAVANVLGFDPAPYVGAAQKSAGFDENVDKTYSATQGAEVNPFGLAGITRAVAPSVVQGATAFASAPLQLGVIGTTILGQSTEEYDKLLSEQYPDMDIGKRNNLSLAFGGINAAAQTALERFSPFQKLARGMGPAEAKKLVSKLAWAAGTGSLNEALQQIPEEAIKLGINPTDKQFQEALGNVFQSGFYGAFGEGAAPIIGSLTGHGETQFNDRAGQPATAADLRAADVQVAPTTPAPIAQAVLKSREGDNKGQPLTFADDYAKAQYIAGRPDFRGDLKTIAQDYVSATDAYRAANPQEQNVARSSEGQGTQLPVAAAASGDQLGTVDRVGATPAVVQEPVAVPPNAASSVADGNQLPPNGPAVPVQDAGPSVQSVPSGTAEVVGNADGVRPVQARRPADRATAVERMRATFPSREFEVAPQNKQQARMAATMKERGLEVVFYDGKGSDAGITSPETPGVLFIKRSQPVESLHEAMLHEFGHDIQNNEPALFAEIQKAVGDTSNGREAAVVPFGEVANNAQVRAKLDPTVINKIKALLAKFIAKFNGTNNPVVDKAIELLDQNFAAPMAPPGTPAEGGPLPEVDESNPRPSAKYGYWYTKDGKWLPVNDRQGHEDVSRDNGLGGTNKALEAGNVRMTESDREVNIEARSPSNLEGLRGTIRDMLSEGKTIMVQTHESGGIKLEPGLGDTKSLREAAMKFNGLLAGTLQAYDFFTPKSGDAKATKLDKVKDAIVEDANPKAAPNIIRRSKEELKGAVANQNARARNAARSFSTAIETQFGKPYNELSEVDQAGLLAALKGAPTPFLNYGGELQQSIASMRDMIDSNTDDLVAQLRATGKPVDRRLASQLEQNKGFYTNLSYRVFEKKQEWIDKVMGGKGKFGQVKADYLAWLDARFQKGGVTLTPAQLEGEASGLLKQIAGETVFGDSMRGQGIALQPSGQKSVGILKRRQTLPAELRAALGQNVNAGLVFHQTVAKQAMLIAAHEFQDSVREAGLKGGWLKTQREEGFDEPISRENDARSPFKGLFTTPEIAQALAPANGDVQTGMLASAARGWRKLNAISRQAVTVGSSAAFMANYIGQPAFLIANGVMNPVTWAKTYLPSRTQMGAVMDEHPTAAKVMKVLTGGWAGVDATTRLEIERLTKLGLLNDSVLGREAIEASRELGLDPDSFDFEKKNAAKKVWDKTVKGFGTFYNLSDTRAKLLIFENAVSNLKKAHPTWSADKVDSEAAERALNTYPSHQRAYEWAKEVSRSGVLGPFAVFSAEMLRTTKNNLVYGIKDMAEGSTRMKKGEDGGTAQFVWGLKRYIAIAGISVGIPALASYLTHAASGLDDDDEDKLRKQLPPWLRDTTGVFIPDREKKGSYNYFNLSRYLPVLMFSDIVRAAGKGDLLDAATLAANPVTSEQPLTSRVLDVKRNATQTGRPIYNPEDTAAEKTRKAGIYLLAPLVPDMPKRFALRILPAWQDRTDRAGKPLDLTDEVMRAFGVTVQTVDTSSTLEFKAGDHNNRLRNANTIFTDSLTKVNTGDEEDVVAAYERAEDARFKIWQDTYDAVESARKAGLTDPEIQQRLRTAGRGSDGGMGLNDISAVMQGKYLPYDFSGNEKYAEKRAKYPDKVQSPRLVDIYKRRRGMPLTSDR